MKSKCRIFSDGGSDNLGNAAGASIVEFGDKFFCTAHYLGSATNNEGEIFSGLAGFALIQQFYPNNSENIEWISDSQYALKSANEYIKNWERNGWRTANKEPVKNQGLWKTFLNLTKKVSFRGTHVKGHSGHPENEACDMAVGWARANSSEFYNCRSQWLDSIVNIGDNKYSNWCFRDSRELLALIRENSESGITVEALLEGLNFSALPKGMSTRVKSINNIPAEAPSIEMLVKKLSKSYLKKLHELDPKKEMLKTKSDFSEAIKSMKRWLD